MESWQIKDYTLEYDDDTHTYIVDGVIVPSVTQILGVKFGNKYDHVNRSVLDIAAARGTKIHKAIEEYCTHGKDTGLKEVRNFRFLKAYYGLDILENEVPIIIFKDDTPIAAGRLDMVFNKHVGASGKCIADIKTTSVLDKEYLTYQLNLYRMGYMQSYGGDISDLYGIHLREDKRKLVKIDINEDLARFILNEYERGTHE